MSVGRTDRQTDHFRSPAAHSLKNSFENDTIIFKKKPPVMLDSWSMINDTNNLTRDIIHCRIFFVYTIVFTFCYENAKFLQIICHYINIWTMMCKRWGEFSIRRKASFSRSEFLVRLKQHCKRISDMQWNNFKSLLNLVLSVLISRSVLND